MKNIVERLENSCSRYPDKTMLMEPEKSITYKAFVNEAKAIACKIIEKIPSQNQPVVILIDKSIQALVSMMGVLYSGNYYTILDVKMPVERMECILNTLQPSLLISDHKQWKTAEKLNFKGDLLLYEENKTYAIEEANLLSRRRKMIDTDPAYVLFTSGSTGIPKGTVVSHRSVLAYAHWVVETFAIDETTIFGNQTPFYFSMSVLDIYATLLSGASLYLLPKLYFSFPAKLLDCMIQNKINTIYWVPSALGIVANLKGLEVLPPKDVKKVLFAGEVMPTKILNIWRRHLPDALYANLYGPTEVTDICTYYIVNRDFADDEALPIGNACNNCDVIVLKEDGTQAKGDEAGELCVRGSFLANGYYDQVEKTSEVFIQNPLQPHYPELIYRSGDIVKYNEYGELMYLSRKDFQIKHMGYRIELGEIETAMFAIEGMDACACIYDTQAKWIILYYQGKNLTEKAILEQAKAKLPNYMWPNKFIPIKRMPYNANGKIDRKALKAMYAGG